MSTLSLLVRVTFAADMMVDDYFVRYEVMVVVMRTSRVLDCCFVEDMLMRMSCGCVRCRM